MLVPPVSIKNRTVADLVVLATYSGKLNTSAIPLCEKTTTHWTWEIMRVASTHPVNPPEVAQGGGVLCSRVAQTGSRFGGSE